MRGESEADLRIKIAVAPGGLQKGVEKYLPTGLSVSCPRPRAFSSAQDERDQGLADDQGGQQLQVHGVGDRFWTRWTRAVGAGGSRLPGNESAVCTRPRIVTVQPSIEDSSFGVE
jgi:hypothetical protein